MDSLTLHLKCKNDQVQNLYKSKLAFDSKSVLSIDKDDAGFDLYFPEDLIVPKRDKLKIDLGVAAQMFIQSKETNLFRTSYYLYPRSSISKTPLRLANSVGIIDRGYTGNLLVVVDNNSDTDYKIEKGQRLFQLCGPHLNSTFRFVKIVDSLEETSRGDGGFGSTGK